MDMLNSVLNKDLTLRTSLKSKDFIVFLRQFSSLMNAGILLVDAVDLLAVQSTSLTLKEALEELSEDIREGITLSEAMGKKPKLFPDLLIHMIHSAEVSGRLEEALQQMADYYEKQHRIKQKITTAMTYPLIVGVLAFFITAFLLVFIVPIFGDMFASMGSDLPAITQNSPDDEWFSSALLVAYHLSGRRPRCSHHSAWKKRSGRVRIRCGATEDSDSGDFFTENVAGADDTDIKFFDQQFRPDSAGH